MDLLKRCRTWSSNKEQYWIESITTLKTPKVDLKQANQELNRAQHYQKRTQKCKLILLLSLVVLLLFVIVVTKPYQACPWYWWWRWELEEFNKYPHHQQEMIKMFPDQGFKWRPR